MNESDTLPNREDIDQAPKINSTKPRDNNVIPVKTPPAVVNKAIFLCDSNGKFLDKRKLFPPGQDFTFYRSPTITHVRTVLQDEINQELEHPQLILIHSGTNNLTPTTPIDDFISDISVLITQASTMFPKSKIIYSTLLPRADIPLQTLLKINMKLIDSLSTLPNVHLVSHENIFSKGTDILHDIKHLKKRHLGLFAANLVAAVRGRATTKTVRSSPNPVHRPRPSTSHPLYTTPMEVPGFLTHTVKNSRTRAYPTARTQRIRSEKKPNTTDYVTMRIQTSPVKTAQALLYSPQKRKIFVHSQQTKTPIKIKDFARTSDNKIVINDMTYVRQPTAGEYSFQYADVPEEKQIATNIIDILNEGKEWDRVSLKAKVIQKKEAIQVGSKKLKLAVATVSDSTASIPLDIWEEHIQRIEIGQVYLMEPMQVRVWSNKKKLATQKKTNITQIKEDQELNDVEIQKHKKPPNHKKLSW